MTTLATDTIRRARAMRAGADSWLRAAFLLLFGAAVLAAMPSPSSRAQSLLAQPAKGAHGRIVAEYSERCIVRAQSRVARAVQSIGAAGGSDLHPVCVIVVHGSHVPDAARANIVVFEGGTPRRAYSARAPPALTA